MGTIDNLKNPRTFASSFWCQRERKGGQNRRIAGYLNLEKEMRIKWQITPDSRIEGFAGSDRRSLFCAARCRAAFPGPDQNDNDRCGPWV